MGEPAFTAFLRRNFSGSIPIFFAKISSTLSTAKAEIGEPGARYAADLGRFDTTSNPIARAFGMMYGANAHIVAFITGEPGKAPA